jgi:type I restriction enzyme S subunit
VKKLEELGDWQSGGTPSRQVSRYFGGKIPWYTSGELNEMYVSKSMEYVTEEAIRNSNAKILEPNTLLLGMYDTAALKSSITTINSACNQAIAFSKLESQKADIIYVYHAIQYAKEHFRSQQRGVRQKNLNLTMIREIKLPIPPIKLQQQFASIVAQVEQLRQKQKESERELEHLFQSLLQKYFG